MSVKELDETIVTLVKEQTRLIDAVNNRMKAVCSADELNKINVILYKGMMSVLQDKTLLTVPELRPYILSASID